MSASDLPSPTKNVFAPPAWHSVVRVGLVLAIGWGASTAWWLNERRTIRRDAEIRLENTGDQLSRDLVDRLSRIEHLLYGARGLYTVNGTITQRAWDLYWNSGDAAAIPGLQALTYLRRVEPGSEASFLEEMRSEFGPGFQLKSTENATGDHVVIVLRRAFPAEPDFSGVDRRGEPAWTRGAEVTRRTGQTLLSGIVPAIADPSDTRMMLVLPIYRYGASLVTDADRRTAHLGWIAAGLRPRELFTTTFSNLPSDLVLELDDVTDAAPSRLFTSLSKLPAKTPSVGTTLERTIYGRHLRFRVLALPTSNVASRETLANEVFAAGLMISALIGTLIWGSSKTERRSLQIASRMTRELHEREWALREAQRLANLATCIYHVDTDTVFHSEEYCRITGIAPGLDTARTLESLLNIVHPDDRALVRSTWDRMRRAEVSPPFIARLQSPTRGKRILACEQGLVDESDGGSKRIITIIQDITDRVATDQALSESHRRMENLMRAIPGAIFQLQRSSDGKFTVPFVSEGAGDLFALSAADLTRDPSLLFRCVNEDGSGDFLRSLETSAETLAPWHFEAKISRTDIGDIWIRFSAVPMRDLDWGTVVWNGVAMDATETKKAEQALRESEQRLRMTQFAVDHVKDAVAFISPQGDRIYVNDETCRLTGHTREELLKTKIWSTFASFTLETYCQMWAYVKNRGTHVFEATLRTRSGEPRSVEVSVSFIGFGGQEMVFAIARDISARKAAEQLLRDSEERLRFTQFALDHARDIVSIIDRSGNRLYVNETYCRFTGRDRDELFRTKVWETLSGMNEARYQSMWDDVKRTGSMTYEVDLHLNSGVPAPLEVNASYLNFSGREAVCTISRDLTARRAAEQEKKRMQQQLQETQKLESLGVLAGGIAHDFNNLLTGVLGNASLARDRLSEASDLHEPLRQIERAAMRAAELCQQMLAYAGKGRFVVEPVNLSALVEDTAKLLDLSVARRARLELRLAPTLPTVLADATQLRQIVMNLVLNAAEATTQSQGVITVVTGRMQVDRKFLASARVAAELPEGEGVFLEVSDTGTGMSKDTLERIFEPFFTTKFTGRGLGLAAVLGIVRSHRGALHVTSELGRGTTFRLVLAAHDIPASASPGTPPLFSPPKRNQGRILVVDDEESVRSVTKQALERTGFVVETAADGEIAIARLQEGPNDFSVVLLDYTMPRIDGAQTLREFRRINPNLRVVLMSGFPEMEARERLGDQTLAGFIQKPFDISSLRKCVDKIVQSPAVDTTRQSDPPVGATA